MSLEHKNDDYYTVSKDNTTILNDEQNEEPNVNNKSVNVNILNKIADAIVYFLFITLMLFFTFCVAYKYPIVITAITFLLMMILVII